MSKFNSLKVAIVGAGSVGSALGANLLRSGAAVTFGARNPSSEKTQQAVAQVPGSSAMSLKEASTWATHIILCLPGMRSVEEYKDLAQSLGSGASGKIIIDATNPLSAFPGLEVHYDGNTSGGEMCAQAFGTSFVFKAFNTIGVEHMEKPDGSLISGYDVSNGPLTMLFAGEKEKEADAAAVIECVGFRPVYIGPIRYARNLEAMAELWIHLAVPPAGFTRESWGRAFHFQVIGK